MRLTTMTKNSDDRARHAHDTGTSARSPELGGAAGSASVQPPIDNEHVAPGCQLFESMPVPKGWKFSDTERLNFLDSHGEWSNCVKSARDTIDEAMRASWPNNEHDRRGETAQGDGGR